MTAKPPLVSIVVPVWLGDHVRFFREAIESLRTQSYPNLEVIIVEDGALPPDLRTYVDGLPRESPVIRSISLQDGPTGPSTARNRGIDAATGDFIAFLDADDVAVTQRVERQLAFLEREALDVCGCCYRIIDEAGKPIEERRVPLSNASIRRNAGIMNPIGCSMMFGKAAVFRGYSFDPAIAYGEDYDLNVRMLRAGVVMANQAEYLVNVRAGANFLRRRRGWNPFTSDLRNRWRGLSLAPWPIRPYLAAGAFVLVAARLMPTFVLRGLYAIRGRLRFNP